MPAKKQPKSKKRQNIGNRSVSEGIAYQCMATTSLVLKMLLYDTYKLVKQNNFSYVDDISTKNSDNSNNYCQCKISGDLPSGCFSKESIKKIIIDFYKQYKADKKAGKNDNRYVLFSQSQPKNLRRIICELNKDADSKQTAEKQLKSMLSKSNYKLFNELFNTLAELKIEEKPEIEEVKIAKNTNPASISTAPVISLTKKEYVNFLKKIDLWSQDFKVIKDDFYPQLEKQGYPKHAYHIINTTLSYDWLSQDISKNKVITLLKNFDIDFIEGQDTAKAPRPPKTPPTKRKFILLKVNERFFNKLNFILDFIDKKFKTKPKEKNFILEVISKNNNLTWHFLHNLKDSDWFVGIKENIIQSVIKNSLDSAAKYQLLSYLEICADKYSDEIISLLVNFEKNTRNPNILVALVKTIAKLKPSKKENLKPIWQILETLAEHQHPWIRKEIPETLKVLAEYDLDKSLNLLEKVTLFNPVPRDITQGTPTLALTFQGRDNENWVFEQATKTLRELMADKRFIIKAFELAIKLEINSIKEQGGKDKKVAGITLDYSYIWLSNAKIDKLDYEYDRRKRFALEIENCLNNFVDSDIKLTETLLNKLLQTKYEVFYLTAIKILMEHTGKYLKLTESIVFDKNLWKIPNIQNYFLQTLIKKYFNIKRDHLSEYVGLVKFLKCKDKERMDYLKQDLFISIPQKIRTEKINKALNQLEKKLKKPAKIQKSFVITSWAGTKPNIKITELKKKEDDELIKIMEDCTAGRRKVDAYNLSPVFSQLIKDRPDRLLILLDKMRNKQIDQKFSVEMMRVYIEVKKTNPQDILNIFWKLQKTDTWARTEIARFINKEYRKEKTAKIGKVLEQVKAVLFELSNDKDPDDDETIKSNNPRPEDAITRGINSVRGIATEGIVILSHYFPQDKEIIKKLKLLSKDKTKAVRATLIYNLKFLITKNYTLCKNIVNQFKNEFKNERDPEIDFALINYFSYFGPRKFQANKEFIKLLFNSPNKEIQKSLGELIGRRYVSGFNLEELVESIIKQRIGEIETRWSLAFVFESSLGDQIAIKKHKRVISYLKKLLDPSFEPDFGVREQASFIFERKEVQTKYFKVLDKNKIFNTILKDKHNILAQNYLVSYLQRCILANESLERCIEILHTQVMKIEGVLSDNLIVQKIVGILNKIFETRVSKKTRELSEEIFDKGLERGWDEFYGIFQKFRKWQRKLENIAK